MPALADKTTPANNGTLSKSKTKAKQPPRRAQSLAAWKEKAAHLEATAILILAIMLLMVSLPHLAAGIRRITGSSVFTAWLMAIVFDLSMVVCEVALILVPLLGLSRRVAPVCKTVVIIGSLMSMVLNVDEVLQPATSPKGHIRAVVWGCLLPLGVIALSYIGSAFILHNKD